MKVLYVSYQDPFGVGGGSYASHAYLKAFSQLAEGNIDIVIAEECDETKDTTIVYKNIYKVPQRNKFIRTIALINGVLHRYNNTVKRLLRCNDVKYDYIVFSGCFMGGSLAHISKKRGVIPITIHHNYEPEYFRDNMNDGLMKNIIISHVCRSERRAYLNSDLNFFLTSSDMKKFEEVYGTCKGENFLIATFEYNDDYSIKQYNHERDLLTFIITGALNNMQGVDGVRFFFDYLYAKLPSNCKVIVAGKSPTAEVIKLCSQFNNVELIASPKDMNSILDKADVYICPTRLGGGMKLRVMDGLKHGLPVLTHECSARGYDLFFGNRAFKIFNTAEEFEIQLNQLLKDKESGLINRDKVLNIYRINFSLKAGRERIQEALKSYS